jgi:hypothetical protein
MSGKSIGGVSVTCLENGVFGVLAFWKLLENKKIFCEVGLALFLKMCFSGLRGCYLFIIITIVVVIVIIICIED